MRHTRYRSQHMFWVDLNKPEEYKLAVLIQELKSRRAFARTVRNGLRLMYDLSQGRTDVLRELYPWVLEQPPIEAQKEEDSQIKAPAQPFGQEIKDQLQRLEQLLVKQKNGALSSEQVSAELKQVSQNNEGPKAMSVGNMVLPPPTIEEDLDKIIEVKREKGNGQSANNLIQSAMALVETVSAEDIAARKKTARSKKKS